MGIPNIFSLPVAHELEPLEAHRKTILALIKAATDLGASREADIHRMTLIEVDALIENLKTRQ